MNKIKVNKDRLWGAIICICIIIGLVFFYDTTIKSPTEINSPRVSGKLFELILFYIDKYLGKPGIFTFFGLLAAYFIYKAFKTSKNEE